MFCVYGKLELKKLEILGIFRPKLGKLVSKLVLKLEKWKILELAIYSNSKL